MAKVAVLGHGVVGSGVVELFHKNKDSIEARAGQHMEVKYILDIRDFPDLPYHDKFTKDFQLILNDPEITVVAEVMGGLSPAFEYVKSLLEHGKSVVTSNKELVAEKGALLLHIAKEHNVNFFFEASVGGGIPIIRPMHQCLAANEITEIAGILNGTTNFILTKMIREQMSFEDALALAQKLGYAERNPAADIEGHDACRKICILSSLAYGKHVYPEQVHTEGITKITLQDVEYAASWGGVIKLIGQVKKLDDGRIDVVVAPMFIEENSQLANVDDVFNGILVRGDATGDVVFYGKGAGKLPTASAVVADIIDCVKHFKARKYLYWEDGAEQYVLPYEDSVVSMYIRGHAQDVDAAAEKAGDLFGKIRRLYRDGADEQEFAFVTTREMKVRDIQEKVEALQKSGVSVDSMIRVSDL